MKVLRVPAVRALCVRAVESLKEDEREAMEAGFADYEGERTGTPVNEHRCSTIRSLVRKKLVTTLVFHGDEGSIRFFVLTPESDFLMKLAGYAT